MSPKEYITCYRFNRNSNEVPIRDQVIDDYLVICKRYLESHVGKTVEVEQWPPFSLRCEQFSIDFWPAFLDSRVMQWNADIANLFYSICKAGGLSVLLPKAVLLVDPDQSMEVPELWRGSHEILPCPDTRAIAR